LTPFTPGASGAAVDAIRVAAIGASSAVGTVSSGAAVTAVGPGSTGATLRGVLEDGALVVDRQLAVRHIDAATERPSGVPTVAADTAGAAIGTGGLPVGASGALAAVAADGLVIRDGGIVDGQRA
jgi:hypothetical protein